MGDLVAFPSRGVDDGEARGLVFPLPSIHEQADLVERHGVDTLLYCRDAWALRHQFVNQETGEVVRARCNKWSCLYCGPRKVDQWRQVVKAAEPTLFITLSKAGTTVEEAARALTTFLQYLRRGSKGRGKTHVGARPSYAVEYFAVLERHTDFEENGFHWHLLVKGEDFIPHEVLREAWRSARHGEAYIVDVQAIRKPHVIGYVTKYLTKNLTTGEKGVVRKERVSVTPELDEQETILVRVIDTETGEVVEKRQGRVFTVHQDEQGQLVERRRVDIVEVVSKARRIRYSRQFFPERVADLRARLFAGLDREAEDPEQVVESEPRAGDVPSSDESGLPPGLEEEQAPVEDGPGDVEQEQVVPVPLHRGAWSLVEREPFTDDAREHRRRRRAALLGALREVRSGERRLSRRVISVWAYQRSQLRWAS